MKRSILLIVLFVLISCTKKATDEELDFVESHAWVRSDLGGFSTCMFYFDTLTGESFQLCGDTLIFRNEIQGIIYSVDTINKVIKLRSLDGWKNSNYKKTNRYPVHSSLF